MSRYKKLDQEFWAENSGLDFRDKLPKSMQYLPLQKEGIEWRTMGFPYVLCQPSVQIANVQLVLEYLISSVALKPLSFFLLLVRLEP